MPFPEVNAINLEAEKRLRKTIAREFERIIRKKEISESAAAIELRVDRQRFKQYLLGKATPKSDVLLRAMAIWDLKITYEGTTFAKSQSRRRREPPPEQLTLDFLDTPQVLQNDAKNIEVKLSRKSSERLTVFLELRLAG